MVSTNQKSTIGTHTKKKKESKYNTKVSHQITSEQNKRGKAKEEYKDENMEGSS